MAKARTVMVQGCTSNAGKSLIVTALCRIARDTGLRVAPFKPQNMANNSAVTTDRGEIGRAQALQAFAAGIEPHTDMNPVLLKPSGDKGSQVIVQGKVIGNMTAREYMDFRPTAFEAVLASHQRLAEQYDLVIVEGAGSPAEINLRQHDIANMGFAEAVNCPVWLVGNIDYGGVFAHLYGTLALLSDSERARISQLIINGFRGDASLLDSGIEWLERETGKSVAGVIPMVPKLILDAEDSLSINQNTNQGSFKVAIPKLARISNISDFDALASHPQIDLIWIQPGQRFIGADFIILPGSKTTIADLLDLRANGWDSDIESHLQKGKKIMGICGGFQMLGQSIKDPNQNESEIEEIKGLGILPIHTTLNPNKTLRNTKGTLWDGAEFTGYEIHLGKSEFFKSMQPFCTLEDGNEDGLIDDTGTVIGTYQHGIFDDPRALNTLLKWAGLKNAQPHDYVAEREREIVRFSSIVKNHLEANALGELLDIAQFGK